MVLAVDPKEYLARIDKMAEIVDNSPPSTPTSNARRFADVVPTSGTVAYVDNSQFFMTMFFALALVIIFLYLMEKDKHYTQHQGG